MHADQLPARILQAAEDAEAAAYAPLALQLSATSGAPARRHRAQPAQPLLLPDVALLHDAEGMPYAQPTLFEGV